MSQLTHAHYRDTVPLSQCDFIKVTANSYSTLTTLLHLEPLLHLGSFITFEASIQQRTEAQLILQNVAYCCMPSRLKSLIT